ncbi:MAG: hypothetical protein IKM81_12555 [Fibrobacter sp.]|nr:hypothetical protein [Fibrobacter sp.]
MKKCAVLMYNFNDYEIMREIPDDAVNDNIEYIYVTDNPSLKSRNWKIWVDRDLDGLPPFEKCYRTRFNLAKYTNADYIMYIDGSIQILKDPMIHFTQLEQSGCDMSIVVHPERTNMLDEYITWTAIRNYDIKQGFKCLAFMHQNHYDVRNYKGLYQGGFRVIKNTSIQMQLDRDCYDILSRLGDKTIERNDQTIYSFLLNTKYSSLKLLPYSDSCIFSSYLNIQNHNMPFKFNPQPKREFIKNGYVRNSLVKLNQIK